jgi:hypothetical protein
LAPLPRVARIQSSFALRDVIDRGLPAAVAPHPAKRRGRMSPPAFRQNAWELSLYLIAGGLVHEAAHAGEVMITSSAKRSFGLDKPI